MGEKAGQCKPFVATGRQGRDLPPVGDARPRGGARAVPQARRGPASIRLSCLSDQGAARSIWAATDISLSSSP